MTEDDARFTPVAEAIRRFAANETVLIVAETPGLECRYCAPASLVTGPYVSWLTRRSESPLLVAMDHTRLDELGINLVSRTGTEASLRRPFFTETVDLLDETQPGSPPWLLGDDTGARRSKLRGCRFFEAGNGAAAPRDRGWCLEEGGIRGGGGRPGSPGGHGSRGGAEPDGECRE